MAFRFKDGDTITDEEFDLINEDPMAEDCCIRCGTFSNWFESKLCDDCAELLLEED